MNARIRQYLFALIFFGVGFYQLYRRDYLEASLYLLAALAFTVNNLTAEPRLIAYKKILAISTWALIGIVALLFLYMLQFKYL
jgi:hypothetical protein